MKYPNIPLYVDTLHGAILVRLYSLTTPYVYAKTKIVCRDTGSNAANKLEIDVILSEIGNFTFNKIVGSPSKLKFYKDSNYLYCYFSQYCDATISYIGGNAILQSVIGGVIMPSADVSGMTEITVP